MAGIIVGVDGSARGEDALAFAEQLADATGAPLRLVSAYPYQDWPSRAASRELGQALDEDTRAMLDRMRSKLAEPDVPVHSIADPTPARALQLLAEQTGASLIVVGSSHRSRVGRVLLGGTAERLLHGAPCSVAVVPHGHPKARIGSIGVGYDGSPEGTAAVNTASTAARRFGASLRVIRVFDVTSVASPALMYGPAYEVTWKDAERHAQEDLEQCVAGLPDDIETEGVLLRGSPRRELAAQSEGLDLMVLGSRGYGPARAVLLGGVGHGVLHEAACPVMVLPRGARHGVDELFAPAAEASA